MATQSAAAIPPGFKGAARPIADIDLPRIGATIDVGEDELHAFMDVEANGEPFDEHKRPKMLFEPHRFYAKLGAGAKRNAAVKAGLARKTWKVNGKVPKYPADSYPLLIKAMAIDESAALMACSWGLSQILAEWHWDVGYATPQAMVAEFCDSAANHLEATVRLLVKWKIDDDLRAHRWEKVAEVWNGEGYRTNRYHTKMAAAFAKWRGIRDTPWTPEAAPLPPAKPEPKAVAAEADKGDFYGRDTVARVQKQLFDLGYTEVGSLDAATGEFDGVYGKLTKGAVLAFRNENDLPVSDAIDEALIIALARAKPRALPRNDAKPEEVRSQVPEVRTNWLTKVGAIFVTVTGAAGALFDGVLGNLGAARGYVQPLQEAFGDVPGWAWLGGVAVIAGGLWLVARHGEKKGVEAYQSGERR